jgi:hypothetical protein
MNNKDILLIVLLLIVIIIFLTKTYYDKFTDVQASVVYLKAPTKNLTQSLKETVPYSCNDKNKCNPKTIEPFDGAIITENMVQDKLDNINKTIDNIYGNLISIYNKLFNYYDVHNKKTVYFNNFKNSYVNSLNNINSNIQFLEDKIVENFENLPTIDKNKKEISSYIVFN